MSAADDAAPVAGVSDVLMAPTTPTVVVVVGAAVVTVVVAAAAAADCCFLRPAAGQVERAADSDAAETVLRDSVMEGRREAGGADFSLLPSRCRVERVRVGCCRASRAHQLLLNGIITRMWLA